MKSHWKNAGLSAILTVILLTGGYLFFVQPTPVGTGFTKIEKEFVEIYKNVPQDLSSPRARFISDLKLAYQVGFAPELSERLNNPRQAYPLLDQEMIDFAFNDEFTGNVALGQNSYVCRLRGNTLFLDGKEVSQENYRITKVERSDMQGYDVTCVNLVKETKVVIDESIPKLISRVQNGEFEALAQAEAIEPSVTASFFGDYSGWTGLLKIPFVLSLLFIFFTMFGYSKEAAGKKIAELKANSSKGQLNPESTTPRPASFMDTDSYQRENRPKTGRR